MSRDARRSRTGVLWLALAACTAGAAGAACSGPTGVWRADRPASDGPGAAPALVADAPAVEAQHRGTTQQGRFAYAWTSAPDPIPFNERFALTVTVSAADAPDVPLPGATLEANAMMPEHGHGMNTIPRVERTGDGTFRVDGMLFHMPGLWHLLLVVKDGDAYDSALVPITLE